MANMQLPTWDDIEKRAYQEWQTNCIVIDTAGKDIRQCETELKEKVSEILSPITGNKDVESIDSL